MPISYYSFAWTIGIGLPVLALVVWKTKLPAGRSWFSRIAIATVVAFMITPTICTPFDKTYVEAAVVILVCGVVGFASPVYSFLVGGLPIILVTAMICGVWHRSQKRSAPNDAPSYRV